MNDLRYPRLEIKLEHLKKNTEVIVRKCEELGISVCGVIKGASGIPEVAKAIASGGVKYIASSRLEQIEDAKKAGIDLPMLLIRIPMLSEIEDVVRLCEYSLNSEKTVLAALNEEAKKQNKVHGVILMADVGDLREGYWDKDEMVDVAVWVENDLANIHLLGVGTNIGCYGSLVPTIETENVLVDVAERIEERIGRKLEVISGGASTSLMRVWDKDMPEKINMLRVGEQILLARDNGVLYGYDESELNQDCFRIKAEVIEVKDKPTFPVGTRAFDAFGHQVEYVDRGIRKRALIALGKADYGSNFEELEPLEEGVVLIGASSDHTIIDCEDMKRDLKVGDILEFGLCYSTLVYLSNSRNVNVALV